VPKLRRSDILDTEITDAVELLSDGTAVLKTGVAVVTVVGATKTVSISGWSLRDPDNPVETGDKAVISGNAAAGTYTVASIVNNETFTVVESIVDATGGTVEFRYPPGAIKVGLDPTGFSQTSKKTVQEALKDIDAAITGGGITEAQHKVLRQLIHLADGVGGPFEGFSSGAYREVTGAVFPTAVVWWDSAAKNFKIVEKLITWTGVNPTTIVWKVYDAVGVLQATVTDTISYTGIFETSRTRAVT
jgi:hypothetical protein